MRLFCFLFGILPALAQQYVVSTVAGGGAPPLHSVAAETSVGLVTAITGDSNNRIYIATETCVFRIDPDGQMTRIAGNGRVGYSGDRGPATDAALSYPTDLKLDSDGNLYIADSGPAVVRKVTPGGLITTVPGSALFESAGTRSQPFRVSVAVDGQIFLLDSVSYVVWRLSKSGELTRFAGNGEGGYTGDGGPARLATLANPRGVAVDASGNVYIAVTTAIRKVSPSGIITTIAGSAAGGSTGDGGPALGARFTNIVNMTIDPSGNLYVTDMRRIRKISTDGIVTTVAGGGPLTTGNNTDGGPAVGATLQNIYGIFAPGSGDLYFAEIDQIRRVNGSGILQTIEGKGTAYTGDGGRAVDARLVDPSGVTLDQKGNLYIADNASRIRKVSPGGTITAFAGGTVSGHSGDGGPASAAMLQAFQPTGMATDAAGNLFLTELIEYCVRKVDTAGVISTILGGPVNVHPQLYFPSGLASDRQSALYIADRRNGVVRKLSASGVVSNFAGDFNTRDRLPDFLATDGADNVYVSYAETFGLTKYTPDGKATEIAPDVFPAMPIAADPAGNVYAFTAAGLVKILPDLSMTVIANYGEQQAEEGASARAGAFINPAAMAVDSSGNLFVADSTATTVVKLQPSSTMQAPSVTAVVNGALGWRMPVAPGEIVTLYGDGIGPATLLTAQLDTAGNVAKSLGGVQVFFDGKAAPLVYVSDKQSAAVVPYDVSGSTVVTVTYGDRTSLPVTLAVAVASPGLFTANSSGSGQAAAVNGDGSFNSAAHPAAAGEIIVLFATGEGQTNPAGVDGKPAALPLPAPLLPVSVMIGGQTAEVLYAGGAPGNVAGLMQLNVRIPASTAPGDAVPVQFRVGDFRADVSVTIAVKAAM